MKTLSRISRAAAAAALFLSVTAAYSTPLTPGEALQRAASSGSSSRLRALASSADARLVYTAYTEGRAGCYAFDIAGKGLVVSADDIALPVLGYSDEAIAQDGEVAPGLRYWLETLSAQIDCARNNPAKRPAQRVESDREEIPVMMTTLWNQSLPYNLRCPELREGRCVTGCVATAMAQAMKYHNYPAVGYGKYKYEWMGRLLTFNYEGTEFDWDNMLDSYRLTDERTPATEAVAMLMYGAGVSVNMNYSISGSGARAANIPPALIEYFGYDKGCHE